MGADGGPIDVRTVAGMAVPLDYTPSLWPAVPPAPGDARYIQPSPPWWPYGSRTSWGAALAAALGLEPATVGAPVAVILFSTVWLFFSIGESRRRTTRQLVPSFTFDLRLAGTALIIGVLAAVLLAPVVETGKAAASAGHLLILALPALLMLPLARPFRARAMHRSKERVVVVGSGPAPMPSLGACLSTPPLPLSAPLRTRVLELSSMAWPI